MTLESILLEHPQMRQITDKLVNSIVLYKMSINLDYNKTLHDNGLDDLDCVELAMEIEKTLDIVIPDDVLDFLFNVSKKPPRFLDHLRNKKLEDLGI